eukprot:TRINITY_DN8720_c1_g4_i1.p1 TRINITY_DN8720_c1_g4~~TRINITY_DN8720_c1_g4_i1.p1  ORF type:complete len:806 (+),score=124.06 TRINITY_DN8720_c1_g4_i1:343-2760(+)
MIALPHHGDGHEEQYEVVRPIGSGSFGEVYLVIHRMERRQYVMKQIGLMSTMDAKNREATELEVKLLSEMRHPNIVAYRDNFITHDGNLCILMEYCEHGDVSSYMQDAKQSRGMPDEKCLMDWFIQVCLALHALHHRKILHRDLKTQNIFLTGCKARSLFALKLGDLGIAKVLNSTMDLAQTQIGTPFYMSPELINNKPYSYKSDVWGLGCILYEIINGQRAFDAQGLNGLALKIIKGRYTPITANCSPATESLIKAMLSTNPTHRPPIKDILHTTQVRRLVPQSVRTVIAACPNEAKLPMEHVLVEQVTELGLGSLVNCAGPRPDTRRVQEKLEKAELRKKRDEEMLQRTIALLESCLSRPSGAAPAIRVAQPLMTSPRSEPADQSHYDGFDGRVETQSSYLMPMGPAVSEPAPMASVGSCGGHASGFESDVYDGQEETMFPAVSQRDRMLMNKEEGRRLRAEEASNLGFQPSASLRAAPAAAVATGHNALRPRARTDDVHGSSSMATQGALDHGRGQQVTWLLDYDPMKKDNLGNPFASCRPKVMHSPRRRSSKEVASNFHGPAPPPPQYGEPVPPHAAPPSSMWSSWRTVETTQQPSRPLHSVSLKSLNTDQRSLQLSEDSDASGSLSEMEDGISDVSGFELADDQSVRRRSMVLRNRIEQYRAAIYKHRLKIEMLEYSFAQDRGDTEQAVAVASMRSAVSEAPEAPSVVAGTSRRIVAGVCVPAIVQDSIARLARRCHEGLGSEKFMAARRCLQAAADASEVASSVRLQMLDVLGIDKIGFFSLVDQIVHMERRWGCQETA